MNTKETLSLFWEVLKIIIIALIIVIPIRYFLFQPFLVKGKSMEPNFQNGNYLIVDEISYKLREPQRGEVIVFKYPKDPSQRYIKRIIGLPFEEIEIKNGDIFISKDGKSHILNESEYLPSVYTSGKTKIFLKENQYFVLGDNRFASSDSRRWGKLEQNFIIGKVFLKALPFNSFKKIQIPAY